MIQSGLHLRELRVIHNGAQIAALSTSIPPGEVLVVMGPSGSGKSTLLSAIIGSPPPGFGVVGQIVLNGRDVTGLPTAQRRIGILFQDDLLFPHMSVAQNLGFGLPATSGTKAQRRALIDAALSDADLAGFANRDPATLSGGQRARVALLRTLLAQPEALLLDEPFSRLDLALRDQIRQFVLNRARAQGLPVILVTHDPNDAAAAGGRIVSPDGSPHKHPTEPPEYLQKS